MCGGYKKGENPSALGKNKIQWITDLPAGLRGRVILGKGNEVTIGDRIKRIRKKRRLTQAELAMMSGLSLSAIQGYEQGRYEPKRKSIESIAEVFKIPVDELYDMPAELSTNLAEVGTDCISRQQAIDAIKERYYKYGRFAKIEELIWSIEQLPPAQPGKDKVSDLLYHIYSIQSPHLDVTGVVAKKYYCEELWKELFGKESELPGWMT